MEAITECVLPLWDNNPQLSRELVFLVSSNHKRSPRRLLCSRPTSKACRVCKLCLPPGQQGLIAQRGTAGNMAATCIPGMPHSFGGNRRADACDEQPVSTTPETRSGDAASRRFHTDRTFYTTVSTFIFLSLILFHNAIQ